MAVSLSGGVAENEPVTLRAIPLSTLSRAGVGDVVSQHGNSHCAAYSVAGGVAVRSEWRFTAGPEEEAEKLHALDQGLR